MMNIKRVKIIVFTKSQNESERYLKLFAFMLKDSIEEIKSLVGFKRIITDKFDIKFMPATMSARGNRAHYVINLTQDEEFDEILAKPTEVIFDLLKNDPKWSELV